MKPVVLSPTQARKIILHAAGLHKRAPFGNGREAVYKLIDHLGFVQIDTNLVVERAHHHSIWARVPDYKHQWLDELIADGKIFEFFTSDSGYIPMHDFRFSLAVKEGFASRRGDLTQAEVNLMTKVLNRIGREGPLTVQQFENDRVVKSAGWWDWRPAKVALERLYFDGRLMATRNKKFQKVYDLPENILPARVDTTMPSPEEYARYTITRSLQSMGVAYAKEISWRGHRVENNLVKKELEKLVIEGKVCHVTVEGLKGPLYMLPSYKNKKITLSGDAFILSPFDGLNVFRHRLKDFFDFDYQIECFVPAPKRKYGYFSLPVLIGDTFIARMDSKADRKQGTLIIHNLHFEEGKISKVALGKFVNALKKFAAFNQCDGIVIKKSNKKEYVKVIKDEL